MQTDLFAQDKETKAYDQTFSIQLQTCDGITAGIPSNIVQGDKSRLEERGRRKKNDP